MFELSMPRLDVKIVEAQGKNKLVISTENPLSVPLTGLKATIGEPFADRDETIGVNMAPKTKWSHEFALEDGVEKDGEGSKRAAWSGVWCPDLSRSPKASLRPTS